MWCVVAGLFILRCTRLALSPSWQVLELSPGTQVSSIGSTMQSSVGALLLSFAMVVAHYDSFQGSDGRRYIRAVREKSSTKQKEVLVLQTPLTGGHDHHSFLRGYIRRRLGRSADQPPANLTEVAVDAVNQEVNLTSSTKAPEHAPESNAIPDQPPSKSPEDSSRGQHRRDVGGKGMSRRRVRPASWPKHPEPMGEARDDVLGGRERDQLRRRWRIEDGRHRVANFAG